MSDATSIRFLSPLGSFEAPLCDGPVESVDRVWLNGLPGAAWCRVAITSKPRRCARGVRKYRRRLKAAGRRRA